MTKTVDPRGARDEALMAYAALELACRALSDANTHLRRSADRGGSCSQERADVLAAWQKTQDALTGIGLKTGEMVRA